VPAPDRLFDREITTSIANSLSTRSQPRIKRLMRSRRRGHTAATLIAAIGDIERFPTPSGSLATSESTPSPTIRTKPRPPRRSPQDPQRPARARRGAWYDQNPRPLRAFYQRSTAAAALRWIVATAANSPARLQSDHRTGLRVQTPDHHRPQAPSPRAPRGAPTATASAPTRHPDHQAARPRRGSSPSKPKSLRPPHQRWTSNRPTLTFYEKLRR